MGQLQCQPQKVRDLKERIETLELTLAFIKATIEDAGRSQASDYKLIDRMKNKPMKNLIKRIEIALPHAE